MKKEKPSGLHTLPSELTAGRCKPSEEIAIQLAVAKFRLKSEEKTQTPTDSYIIEELELNDHEKQLAKALITLHDYDFQTDTESWGSLNRESLELIKKLNLTPEQVNLILTGQVSVREMGALNQLRSFEERAHDDREFQEKMQHREYSWQLARGDEGRRYDEATTICDVGEWGNPLYNEACHIPEDIQPHELIGVELTYADCINQLLEKKEEDDNPLIILDIGSMYGISWYRLAHHFQEEIKDGKLTFLATSLGANIDELLENSEKRQEEKRHLKQLDKKIETLFGTINI